MKDKDFLISFLKAGLFMGAIYVLYDLLLYVFKVNIYSIVFGLVSFLIVVSIIILPQIRFGRKYRDNYSGGYMTYGNALLFGLLTLFSAALLVLLYRIAFHNIVDPAYTDEMMSSFLSKMESLTQGDAATGEILDEMYDDYEAQKKLSPLKKAFGDFKSFLILGGIISLVSSAFVRKKQEVF